MFIRLSLVQLILAVAAFGTPVRRDAVQVESDIRKMASQAQALDNDIIAFPNSGGTLDEIIAIHKTAVSLGESLKAATTDVNGSTAFNDAQSDTIIELVAQSLPIIQKGLGDLVAKKSAVVALNAGQIAKDDLETLKNDVDAFGAAIVAKSPADKKSDIQGQIDAIDSASTAAINAYS